MSGLNKVAWAEGVFIGQQHFQAWDRSISARNQFGLQALHAFYWGIVSLEWGELALREGRFELQSLQCVLPNGLFVDFNKGQEAPVFLDLNEQQRDELVVYVAIPNNQLIEGVAGYQSAGRIGGWLAQYQEIADDSDSARIREVMLAKPNVLLKTDRDALDNMLVLRLAKIQKQYDGSFKVVSDILPSCLSVNAVPVLRELVGSTSDMMTNLIREFAQNRMKIGDIASYSSSEMADFLLQKEFAAMLPEFKQFSAHGVLHPYHFYLSLAKLHQITATFLSPEFIGKVIGYQHDALEECLPVLIADIRSMLSLQRERPESKATLKQLSPGRFETTEIPRHALENFSFYLAVDAKQDSVDWVARFVNLVKLASPEQLETVVASGLPGVPMRHVQRLPQKIRIQSGYEYFQISTEGALWSSVLQTQKFGIFCMGEFADCAIELIVLEEN